MAVEPTDQELSAWLEEMLPVSRSTEIEKLLRDRADLRQRAALLARRRDQGGHTVGEIWRRNRLTCLTRRQLGSFILGVTEPELSDYIAFHLHVVECRWCLANVEDLEASLEESMEDREQRERRYFESSAGHLRSQSRP